MNLAIIEVAGVKVSQDAEGRYSLNDLHRAAGGEERHAPNRFTRTETFVSLVFELTPEMAFAPVNSVRGGSSPGTYVVKELVYAYAMWISPSFNLKVIRAYDNPRKLTRAEMTLMVIGDLQAEIASQRLQLSETIAERDHAIKTKSQISSSREASVMGKLSAEKKRRLKLQDELGFSARHATIMQVNHATGEEFNYVLLRRWCKTNNVTPEVVPDKRYPKGVKAWPATAWMECYEVDLAELFGAGVSA